MPGVPVIAGDQGLDWSHHVMQLACHQDLEDHEMDQLVDTLKDLYNHAAQPEAAPVPSGRKQISSANMPLRAFNTDHRSRATFARSWP